MAKALSQTLYGLSGVLYLVAGVSVLLLGTGLLPDSVRDLIVSLAHNDANTLHIMQEFASLLVFVGLITLWFIRHYDQSLPFHWAMTVFWGLIALVHWFDIRGSFRYDVGALINTIPLMLFVLIGLLRQTSSRRRPSSPTGRPITA
jgi:hypothetical protein